ncbi:hypothetical protein DKX38_030088 (mitochondrion) [Salix brachista]|uniref:Uncharacterized protein n=1 Tax=Salix brachista TaxID=2182728 RepID=A0A5N5J1P7_9ROSI|nr:hypothetical protein DKX38_030088 [Salix brachista]
MNMIMPILLGESEDPQLDAEAAAIGEAGGRLGQSCEGGGKRRIFAIGGFGQRLLPEWERVIVKTCTPSRVVNTVHLIQSQKKTEPAIWLQRVHVSRCPGRPFLQTSKKEMHVITDIIALGAPTLDVHGRYTRYSQRIGIGRDSRKFSRPLGSDSTDRPTSLALGARPARDSFYYKSLLREKQTGHPSILLCLLCYKPLALATLDTSYFRIVTLPSLSLQRVRRLSKRLRSFVINIRYLHLVFPEACPSS